MNRKLLLFAAFLPLVVYAQKQVAPQLIDKKGQFAMWFSEAYTEFIDKSTIKFEVSGQPAHGYSKGQNLEFSASKVSGTIIKNAEGVMHLSNATVDGSSKIVIQDKETTSTMMMAKATFVDDKTVAHIEIPGAFTFVNITSEEGVQRQLTLKGTSGTFDMKSLAIKDENPLIGGKITGPIDVVVTETSVGGKKRLYTLKGDHVTIAADGLLKIMTLSGNVHVTSEETGDEQKGFMGEMTVATAIVTFDKNYTIKSIKTKAPGQAQVSEKSGGQ